MNFCISKPQCKTIWHRIYEYDIIFISFSVRSFSLVHIVGLWPQRSKVHVRCVLTTCDDCMAYYRDDSVPLVPSRPSGLQRTIAVVGYLLPLGGREMMGKQHFSWETHLFYRFDPFFMVFWGIHWRSFSGLGSCHEWKVKKIHWY